MNPDWSSKAAAESGGSRISNTPTGIWLDTTGAIPGVGLFNGPNGDTGANGTSLDKHMRNAVALDAANGSTPVYTQSSTTCPTVTARRWPPTASTASRRTV